jgi:SAM-dependent methyltransferase
MSMMSSSAASEPHRHREVAESFGVDPARYNRARPAYPEALIERILAATPGRDILDVGCGTGIVARQFLAAGCTVLGVEPDTRMATFAHGKGVEVDVATFEAWEPAGRMFDAVVAGTAWHWIDPVAGAAKAALVLGRGGVLAPFGTVQELPASVTGAFAEAHGRLVPDSPFAFDPRSGGSLLDAYQGLYLRAAEGIRQAGGFDEPEIWRYDWERSHGGNDLLDLVSTSGGMTRLPSDVAGEVLRAVGRAVDDLGGSVTVAYATWGLTARRTDSPSP